MSRTYRKTQKGFKRSWLPNISKYDIEGVTNRGRKYEPNQAKVEWLEANPHRRNDIGDYFHWMTTPSEWTHQMMTKPKRAQVRALVRKIKTDNCDQDDVAWPLNRKPHIYYW